MPERGGNRTRIERTKTVKRPQCAYCNMRIGVARTFRQQRHRGFVAALDKQALRRVAPPAVSIGQVSNKLGRRSTSQLRVSWLIGATAAYAPNAAVCRSLAPLDFIAP